MTTATGELDPAQIGARVLRLRTAAGLTQRELAEPRYTPAYISTLEAGRVRPSETAMRYLAAKLGTDYEELAYGRPPGLVAQLRLQLAQARQDLSAGTPEDAQRGYTEIAATAAAHGLAEVQADALVGQGYCALRDGEPDAALRHFGAAEELLREAPLPSRIDSIRGRAVAYLMTGQLRYACYLLESAIEELTSSGLHDPRALMVLNATIVAPYLDMGILARAAQAAAVALELAPSVRDPESVARMHMTAARALLAQGRDADADISLTRAHELFDQLELRTETAYCHWMRGYVQAQQGQLDTAAAALSTARDMLRELRSHLYAAQAEVELADVWRRQGRSREAAELLATALSQLGKGRGPAHAGAAHRQLGTIAADAGDPDTAEAHYRKAAALQREAGTAADHADTCRLLGDLLRSQGRDQDAMDAYRAGLDAFTQPGTITLGPPPRLPPGLPGAD